MPSQGSDEKKVIVSFKDRKLLKGYLNSGGYPDLPSLLEGSRTGAPNTISIASLEDRSAIEISLQDVKAVFFVKSFEGDRDRKDLHFYRSGPEVGSIWVEVHFQDGEIMEGTVYNSIHHLIEPGFLLNPSDPGSNNQLVYVNKDAILSYRVLGVRTVTVARRSDSDPAHQLAPTTLK